MDMQLTPTEKALTDRVIKKMQLLSAAFMGVCLVLSTLPWMIWDGSGEPFQFSFSEPIVPILFVLAIVELTIAPYLPRLLQNQPQPAKKDEKALEQSVITPHIIGLALREAAAVFGFVLSILTNDPGWAMLLGTLAAVAILFSWPKRKRIEQQVISKRSEL